MCMIYHEIAHIYRGHLSLYGKWEKEKSVEKHYLDIQTMEWDADCYAASQLAKVVDMLNKGVLINDTTDFALQVILGSILGMMFWERQKDDFDKVYENEHPPMYYREIAIIATMSDLLHCEKEKAERYVIGYEKAFSKVFGIDVRKSDTYFLNAVKNKDMLKKIEENWDVVKEQLKTFSVFPLEEVDELF